MSRIKKVDPKQPTQAKQPESWGLKISLQNARIEHLLRVIGKQAGKIAMLEADLEELKF